MKRYFQSAIQNLLFGLFLLLATTTQAQYMEQFNTAGRGYLPNCQNLFTGVPWTLSVWDPTGSCRISPPDAVTDLRDPDDYFQTAGGALTGIDFDQELCWISPTITVPTSGVGFSVKIGWTQFDREDVSNNASDYIDVEYSTNGGANWTRLPTTVGLGLSLHTVCYRNSLTNNGDGSAPSNQNNPDSPGLTTFNASGISGGGTLIIRICSQFNSTAETITIDDVSVPLGSVGGCTQPTLSTTVTNVSCNGGATGTIDLTVSGGGTPPYTYAWTGGANTQDRTNLAVGTYSVTVTDALMCSATTSATIGVAPAITRSTVVGNATCAAVADGGVDLTVSGGVPPYTYAWTGGAVTQDIDNLAPGTYTVIITDAPGCTSSITATVGVAAAGPYNETFATAGKGYLPNFEDNFVGVSWTIDPWVVTDILNNIIGREADDYYRTSGGALVAIDLDRNICWNSPVIDINPPGSGVSFTVDFAWTDFDREDESNNATDYIDVEYSVDNGAWTRVPTTAPATGLSGHTICYRNNNGGGPSSAPTDNNGSLVLTVPGLSGSTLRIRVCAEFNSQTESMSINSVSVSAGSGVYCPAPESEAGPAQMICDGLSATLAAIATNGTGAWSVVSGPSTSNAQFSSTSAANATFTPAGGAGSYTLRWTVSANGFSDATDDVVITVKAKPSATITPNPSPVCQNTTLNLSAPDAGVGASYNWSGSGVNNANANTTTATPLAANNQDYKVTITAANGCSSIGSITVFVNSQPSATITFGSPACEGSALNLSVPNAGVGASYNWAGPNVVNNNTRATTATPPGSGSKTYMVTVTAANGCSSMGSNAVNVNTIPTCTITGPMFVCPDATTTFNVTPGLSNYNWTVTGGGGNISGPANGASVNVAALSSGTYTVNVTVTNAGGCTSTCSQVVTISPPTAMITGDGNFCGGSSVTLTASGGVSYSWARRYTNNTGIGTAIALGSNNTQVVNRSGVYFVTVTNSAGCTAVTNKIVNIADYVYSGSISGSEPTQLGRLARDGNISTCSNVNSCSLNDNSANRAYDQYSVTNPTNSPICVTVGKNANGCGNSSYVIAYLNSFDPNNICTNYLGREGASEDIMYHEVTVPANQTLIVVVHQVEPGQLCGSYNLYIDIPVSFPALTVTAPNTACLGTSFNLSATAFPNTTYSWAGNGVVNTNSNMTTAVPTVLGSQTYTVSVTTANSCAVTATATVMVNPPLTAVITPNPSPVCVNGTLSLSVPNAGVGATYTWSGNGIVNANSNTTTAVPTATGPQAYSVTITAPASCSATGTVNVTVNPRPSATLTPSPNPVCQNSTLNLSVPNAGGGASYNWSGSGIANNNANATTAVPTATGPQPYAVTVTNANGCSATNSTNVTVNAQPSATITPNPSPVCQNSTLNLSVPSAGVGASYNWSGNGINNANANATTAVPTIAIAQAYAVTVTNANTCSNTGSVNVTVNPLPSATITATQSSACGPALVNLSVPSAGGGASYNWSGNGVVNNNMNATTASPNSGGNQTYQVTVTNVQGCSQTGSTNILINICINGRVIWKTDNTSGVKDVTVALTGDQTASVLTPLNGTYSFNFNSGSSFMITPSKALNKLNGVNAQDVFRLQQHLSGNLLTDPFLLVAADVNSNNTITPLDVNIIQLSLLGNVQALAQFINSWRFVPTTHVMTNPPWGFPEKITIANAGSGLSNQDFYGIKVGDVVALNANPANLAPEPPFVLTAIDKALQAGDEVEVNFQASQTEALTAMQFGLHFDPQRLELTAIESQSALPLSEDNFGLYEKDLGNINFLWAGAESMDVPEAAPVFRLKFKVLTSGGQLSEALQLNDETLPALAFKVNNAETEVLLHYFGATGVSGTNSTGQNTPRLQLLQNQPNPFTSRTLIGFELPEACAAQLRIMDASGRVIAVRTKQYPAGLHSEVFELEGVSGVLYYELTTPFGVLSKKMVVIKG